jgi:hypothetical protein
MNIVDFSEGILGINGNAAKVVAKCLREFSLDQIANDLDAGKRIKIEVIREIGERRLTEIKQRCLAQ